MQIEIGYNFATINYYRSPWLRIDFRPGLITLGIAEVQREVSIDQDFLNGGDARRLFALCGTDYDSVSEHRDDFPFSLATFHPLDPHQSAPLGDPVRLRASSGGGVTTFVLADELVKEPADGLFTRPFPLKQA